MRKPSFIGLTSLAACFCLGACCVDPPPTIITYTGIDIVPEQIDVPGSHYISFSVPLTIVDRERQGKRKPGICYYKVLSYQIENPFDTSRFNCCLNRPLRVGNTLLPAYSNLLRYRHSGMSTHFDYSPGNGNLPRTLIFYADTAVVAWPAGPVKILFRATTARNETFSDSADIFVR
jgi:hypothetical protein